MKYTTKKTWLHTAGAKQHRFHLTTGTPMITEVLYKYIYGRFHKKNYKKKNEIELMRAKLTSAVQAKKILKESIYG